MEKQRQIGEQIQEIERRLLPNEYINATAGAYFSALEYMKYRRNTPFSEVEDYFCDVDQNVEWPPYYVVSEGEFSDNPKINQEVEEAINIYFGLIKDFCEATVNFASRIIDYKSDRNALYQRALLTKKSLEAFDLPLTVYGLTGRISHDTFAIDLDLMKLIKKYLDTGVISKEEIEKFDGYPRLYPFAKIEVYNLIHNTYKDLSKSNQTSISK